MRQLLVFSFMVLSCMAFAQDEEEKIYSEWLEGLYPKSYENVTNMVKRIWGNNDPSKAEILIEFHCKAVSRLMDIRRGKDVDEKVFSAALDKWSLSNEEERLQNWYEWPHTNWVKVLQEYESQVAQAGNQN